ncbi:hypothetical protein BU23DRAFT_601556 [Bimuria novae-zelandiae CBS 107.79]|uniref:Uncharacterized protein n=1 Tax=Bimuria novae-zelandiae CBS 107.79 TaxID=1447943 RepID=A0A6A5UXR8_9PLEO|nr:hypothetical protein BU23DRAFT_601556 [Bimuria novae-zelandiae CBS 107.79]
MTHWLLRAVRLCLRLFPWFLDPGVGAETCNGYALSREAQILGRWEKICDIVSHSSRAACAEDCSRRCLLSAGFPRQVTSFGRLINMSDLVYYGSWINWSRGRYDGGTMTLTPRNAGILVAFLAIFVSVAGDSLWRIIAFILHQRRVARDPRDGLHYQQQVILRNAATPGIASWQLLWLVPAWKRISRRPLWKSTPVVLLALVNLSAFFAAGVLVAEVTRTAGTEVLIRSANCGNWTIDDTRLVYGFTTKTLNDTISAASYARACYGGPSDAPECIRYKVKCLPYTINETDQCPFDEQMCFKGLPTFSLDTGNLSSHDHLGINTQPNDRIVYRRKTSCAPILTEGFVTAWNYTDAVNASLGDFRGSDGDVLDFFDFGRTVHIDGSPANDFTFAYNRRQASMGIGYSLAATEYSFGSQNLWQPASVLRRDDGDLSLIFLMANDIRYYGKVEDPIFSANIDLFSVPDAGQNVTLYSSDYFVNPFACVDQHQFCNPTNGKCTKLDAYTAAVTAAQNDLEYSPMQYGTVSTLALELYLSTISQSIGGRGSSALRAQELVTGLLSGPLPKDQWKKEVEYWFTTGLSKMQKYFVDYASGPSNVFNGTHISKPHDAPSRQLCESQLLKAPPGSNATSFSTLGVAIILAVGGLIIIAHIILEYVVANVVPTKSYKLVRWALDDKLQLQRLAFEGAGVGAWNAGIGAVPTTKRSQTFGMDIAGEKGHPTMVFTGEDDENDDKVANVVVDDVRSVRSHSLSTSKGSGRTWPTDALSRTESIQIPPIRLFDDDREVWPLVRDESNPYSWNGGTARFESR